MEDDALQGLVAAAHVDLFLPVITTVKGYSILSPAKKVKTKGVIELRTANMKISIVMALSAFKKVIGKGVTCYSEGKFRRSRLDPATVGGNNHYR